MGVSANQARLMTLTARQHDLELRAQSISAQKMIWALQSQEVALAYSDKLNELSQKGQNGGEKASDAEYSDAMATYTAQMASLTAKEKILDLELTQINTEHSAVTTEYDAVKSLISENVEKSFNVFG